MSCQSGQCSSSACLPWTLHDDPVLQGACRRRYLHDTSWEPAFDLEWNLGIDELHASAGDPS